MKILQMVDVPWDSGLAHYALILSQGLKRKGHHVFVSAVPGEKPWHKAHRLGLKTLPLVNLKSLGALRRFVREHGIDLINAHTGSTHSLAVAAGIGQSIAVVRTRSDARVIKRRPGSRFLYKHTHKVIAAAEYIRESFIKELALTPRQVVTVRQGISVDDFRPAPLPANPILGIVARLDPVKGHRYLIEALSLLRRIYPSLRLRIVGQEENTKQKELAYIADRLRVDDRVQFLGYQSNVASAMAECSIGVISSTGSEAVSRVALEWMASGRPVVATRVGCLPEIIEPKQNGLLVNPKDAPALASALAALLHEPERAVAMGAAARAYVEKHLTMERFVNDTLGVYRDAVAAVADHV